MKNLNDRTKWFACFVEAKDDNGNWYLSHISWRTLLVGILAKIIEKDDFEWKWVPPWRVKFNTTIT